MSDRSFIFCCPVGANTSLSTLTDIQCRCTCSVAEGDGRFTRRSSGPVAVGADEGQSEIAGRVGSGRVGSGRVGSGRVGSGRVGSGRVVSMLQSKQVY